MNKKSTSRGWVYVISNPAFKDLIKIGFTLKDPLLRAKELGSTGVPYDYMVEYEVFCPSPQRVEAIAHRELAKCREGKEWFRCEVESAVKTIRRVAGSSIVYESAGWDDYCALGSGALESSYPNFFNRHETPEEKLKYISERLLDTFTPDGLVYTTVQNLREGLQHLSIWRSYHPDQRYWKREWCAALFDIAKLGITNKAANITDNFEAPEALHELRKYLIITYVNGDDVDERINDDELSKAQELIAVSKNYPSSQWDLLNLVCYEALIYCKKNMYPAARAHLATYLLSHRIEVGIMHDLDLEHWSRSDTIDHIKDMLTDSPSEVTNGLS